MDNKNVFSQTGIFKTQMFLKILLRKLMVFILFAFAFINIVLNFIIIAGIFEPNSAAAILSPISLLIFFILGLTFLVYVFLGITNLAKKFQPKIFKREETTKKEETNKKRSENGVRRRSNRQKNKST